MPEKLAFFFPGQGQIPLDVPEPAPSVEPLYAMAASQGLEIRAWIRSGDTARLSRTEVAQPTVFLDSIARREILAARGFSPDIVAGHSLGEYAALVAAGVISAEAALSLVLHRGRLMASVPGGMAAVLKLNRDAVVDLCVAIGRGAVLANYNGAQQFVVSGPLDALDELARRVADLGGRTIRLDVSGPFHSPAMRPAEDALSPWIAQAGFSGPHLAFVSSVTGRRESSPAALRELLSHQMTAPVRWTEVLRTLAELGVTEAVEVGGGNILTQLGKRAESRIRFRTFEEVLHA